MGNKFKLLIILFCLLLIPIEVSAKNINEVELGSYINYYPSENSYTTTNTGTTASTINPSELTSWRVLKLNDDNTIEVISTNVSTNPIKFYGTTGYKYYVDELQNAAQSYVNNLFAISARSFGFNDQVKVLSNVSKLNATSVPWSSTTSNNNNEDIGGGDIKYKVDYTLLNTAGISASAKKVDGSGSNYYVASRRFTYLNNYSWYFDIKTTDGNHKLRYYESGSLNSSTQSYSIRPIVTLKSDLKVTGTGTEENPYKIILYTIEFDSDEGTSIDDQYVYNVDSTTTKPTDPTKTGHIFKGWYKNESLTTLWNFDNDVVTSNITLYAKWQKEEYTVVFNSNGSNDTITDQKILFKDKATKPTDPTKTGHIFKGWFKDENLTQEWNFTNDVVTSNMTLYAKWQKEEYIVVFNTNGSNDTITDQKILFKDKATKPTNPTKTGHIFKGWFKDENLTQEWNFANDAVTSNTTLYAKWEKEKFSVTFNINGHGESISVQVVLYSDKTVKPEDLIEEGYIFKGWYTDEELTNEYDFNTTVTSNVMLYAKWEKEEYTISFNTNGSNDSINNQKILYGDKITKPEDMIREGYTFVGWYIDEELTNKYDFDESVSSNITLYAKWMKIENNPKTGVTNSNWVLIIALYIMAIFVAIIAHKKIKKLKGYI